MNIGAILKNRLGILTAPLKLGKIIFADASEQITAALTSCAHMYVTVPAPTYIVAADTYYKMAATTGAYINNNFIHSDNRLTYGGAQPRTFFVSIAFSISTNVKDIDVLFQVYKNGDGGGVVASRIRRTLRAVGDIYIMAMSSLVDLEQNDYVELWASSDHANVQLTLQTMGFIIC